MLYVRIELWPSGDRAKARLLQEVTIVNDETGDQQIGNYNATLSHCTLYRGEGFADPARPARAEVWRRGRVEGFLRKLSPAELSLRALASVFGVDLARRRG